MKEYKYTINGMKFMVTVGDVTDNHVDVTVNGTPYYVELEKTTTKQKSALSSLGKTDMGSAKELITTTPAKVERPAGSPKAVKAPLPGTIMSFKVKVGDTVKSGDTVCILEAMKMENDIHSTKSGVIKEILVNVGDAVADGTDLMIIE